MLQFKKLVKILALGIIISFLLPVIKVGSIGFKPDLIFLFLALPVLMLKQRKLFFIKKLIFITFLIFITMLISNNIGNYYYSDIYTFSFPTEFYQVFSRVVAFILFFNIANYQIIEYKKFVFYFSFVFFIGLFFGVLQFLNIGIIQDISLKYYALTETQMSGFQSLNFRGFGTAGNIITWGGICCMIFYFFYFLVEKKSYRLLGCILSIFNVLITASRAALLALVFSFLIVYFYQIIFIKRSLGAFIKQIVYASLGVILLYILASIYIPDRLEFLELRLSKSEEDLTQGGRGAQIKFFMNFMSSDNWNFLFGIGKPTLNDMGYMEMEPLFLLVGYGIFGVILHYIILVYIYRFAQKLRFVDLKIYLFILGSLLCYLVFSIGFFFFREPYSGMIYWCVLGYLIGYLLLIKKERELC